MCTEVTGLSLTAGDGGLLKEQQYKPISKNGQDTVWNVNLKQDQFVFIIIQNTCGWQYNADIRNILKCRCWGITVLFIYTWLGVPAVIEIELEENTASVEEGKLLPQWLDWR